jgi:23S rRNA pseudouridine1911/1915/1917 synthase
MHPLPRPTSMCAASNTAAQRFVVAAEHAGARLDRYLAERLPELSRTRIQELIDEGRARVNGAPARRAHRMAAGEAIEIAILPRPPLAAVPEAIPLDVLYEDGDLVVVNKPAGMVVHAGAGAAHGTLVNALLHRYGSLSGASGALRPGIVHRLDRGTSGVLVIARNDLAHRKLAEQFRARQVEKTYLALVHGRLERDRGTIELPIARDLRRRTRMTARRREGREARTDWRVLARLDGFTLVEVALHTGRTHQIRVHFSALRHPVVGDALYGAPREVRAGKGVVLPPLGRNFLHAARIRFLHPRTGAPVEVRAALPQELREYLNRLVALLGAGSIDAALQAYL